MGSPSPDKLDGDSAIPVAVAYQKDPTFRVVLPSGQQLGYRHCDADYHHPPAEINWWIPMTTVSDTNTLHTESLPGIGDFSPVNLPTLIPLISSRSGYNNCLFNLHCI